MKKYIIDEKTIRKRMIDKNIRTIGDLALGSGVSKPTIYEYINGKSPIPTSLVKLCLFLDLKPSEIIIETDEEDD